MFGINGARGSKVDEPLTIPKKYGIEWVAPRVNLRELALLRFIQGKTERELARMLNNEFRHANLTNEEKGQINPTRDLRLPNVCGNRQ